MDGVVHFEIPVDDLERAKAFYGTVFDWECRRSRTCSTRSR